MLPPRRIGRDSGLETTRFLARLKTGRNVVRQDEAARALQFAFMQ